MVAGGAAALTTSASLAAQASLAISFHALQSYLATVAIRDILAVWSQVNLRDIRSSWPPLRRALRALIRDQHATSASQGLAYYQQARKAAGVPGKAPAIVVPPPAEPLIQATLDSRGPYGLLGRIKQGQQVPQAAETTGVILSGAAQRLISNGARQAVLQSVDADAKAVAWARVTSSNPCAWCAMLASRGASYRSEASASFEAHSHCQCTVMAVFSAQDAKALKDNPLAQQWREATKGYGGKDALNAWRRHWDAQQGRDGVIVRPAA